MNIRQPRNPGTYSWLILSILALVWGSSFILVKKGLVALDSGAVGAIRILAASLFLLIPAIGKIKLIKSRHLPLLLIVGFSGSMVPAFLFAIAQTQLDSAVAGAMNAITPLWVIIIGIAVFSQKITVRIFTGMLLGFAGTVWLVLAGSHGNILMNYYALYVVAATICYGINLNIIKYKLSDLDALATTSVSLAMVGPLAAGFLVLQTDFLFAMKNDPLAWWSFGAVSLLGVLGTAVALVLFNKLVQVTTPVFASSVTYLIPIVAVIWGMIDGENLALGQFVGMILILAGVFMANRR